MVTYFSRVSHATKCRLFLLAAAARASREGYKMRCAPERIATLREAQVITEGWYKEYNAFRLHSSLNYRPPLLRPYSRGSSTVALRDLSFFQEVKGPYL
jgi:hypothetical protein